MNKIVIITGTPGAGKTTILDNLHDGTPYQRINIGTEMEKVAVKEGLVKDRDEMRRLNSHEIVRLRLITFGHLKNLEGNIVIDTHASVKSGNRYVPGFSISELDSLGESLKGLIYVDSKSEDIIVRRANDHTRKRDVESVQELNQQREISLSLLASYMAHKNIPIHIISNPEGNLEKAVGDMAVAFDDLFKKED